MGTDTAVRSRCEREQRAAIDEAMKWGESPAMRFLFAQVDRLELISDEALGIEGGDVISRPVSRAVDELLIAAEAERDAAIDHALSQCEFVAEPDEPDVNFYGKGEDEQRDEMAAELRRDLPTVEDLAKAARKAGAGRE